MPKIAVKKNVSGGTAAGGAKKSASGAKKSKLYNRPEKIKEGSILKDLMKTEWKIGPSIGNGGFGEIYSASKNGENKYDFVVKCEPHDNGPLFVEMHFYMRNARLDDIINFQKEHNIKSLGMPHMIGNGSVDINGIKHRFIVMPRYGSDVAKYFLANGRKLPEVACYRLALQMLYVYEFIHGCGYVHADLKASNILIGYGKKVHQAYLVDFGLASHYITKDFKPDPKKMHNGTIEYTSRDAHLGVPTMRSDLEILGYNLIEWIGIDLPWVRENILNTAAKVQNAKENFMSDVGRNLNKLFSNGAPAPLIEFFKYVAKMEYNETPDYNKCRKIFATALKNLKVSLTGDLDLKFEVASSSNINSSLNKSIKVGSKKKFTENNSFLASEDSSDAEDEKINHSDDEDVILHKKNKKEKVKLIKNSGKSSEFPMTDISFTRSQNNSYRDTPPTTSKRSKPITKKSTVTSSPIKRKTPLKGKLIATKSGLSPLNARTKLRISPTITVPSPQPGKTIINDRVTPNIKPKKTYEFNFELDVSMDANVIVNVKRKKKPLQTSQDLQNASSKTTHSGTHSNSTPVTKVKVRKVDSAADGLDSPRTPAVTVKKSRRIQQSLT